MNCVARIAFGFAALWCGAALVRGDTPAAPDAGQAVPLPHALPGMPGGAWQINPDGSIASGEIYETGGALFVGGNPYPGQGPARLNERLNELTLPGASINGLNVSRRVAVNPKLQWCRFVEVLENPGAAPVNTTIQINFALNWGIEQTTPLFADNRRTDPVGMTVSGNNQAIVMIAAGRGSKLAPRLVREGGSNTITMSYDVEVPPGKTVAILHAQARRANVNDAAAFASGLKDAQCVEGLPEQLVARLANFRSDGEFFGDMEILRGDVLDVVELKTGDRYKGTLKQASYKLQTFFGPLELPAQRVVAMLTVGSYRPTQLLLTSDGEAFGGTLSSDSLKLELSSGQLTSVPLSSVARFGYRKRADETGTRDERPMARLRGGERLSVQLPAETIPVNTRYGTLQLQPAEVAEVLFETDAHGVHEVRLADGSHFAGLLGREQLAVKLPGVDAVRTVNLPVAMMTRLRLGKAADPQADAPRVVLANGDELIGALSGELVLQTAFDTLRVSAAEVASLRRSEHGGAEVQVTLWDGATVGGRVEGDVVPCSLLCGAAVRVPVAMIEQYTQPLPMPSPQMIERIKEVASQLNAPDWKQRDRAVEQLIEVGPPVAGVLKSLRASQPPEAQQRIDQILTRLKEAKTPPPAPPAAVPTDELPAEAVPGNPAIAPNEP